MKNSKLTIKKQVVFKPTVKGVAKSQQKVFSSATIDPTNLTTSVLGI